MKSTISKHLRSIVIALLLVLNANGKEPQIDTTPLIQSESNDSAEWKLDVHPLKSADTSSPRDTLRSFMTETERLHAEQVKLGNALNASGYQSYSRAVSTLDFNATPDSNSRTIQTERLLMMREILDRIEIPPYSEIPGDDEVAEGNITRWNIPNTPITIKQKEIGSRSGEFLFSDDTVERLDRYYRMVKHLPYQPNAIKSIYETFLQNTDPRTNLEKQIRNRLRSVDISNPRSTLMGFLVSVNHAYALVMQVDAAMKTDPPTMTRQKAHDIETKAQDLMSRAITTLDLSDVPEALRNNVGIESALQLKEIFDRTHIPPIDTIPSANMVATERERLSKINAVVVTPVRWRYPNTAIEIVEILEGENQGNFQFSAATIRHLRGFYEEIRDLPYRGDYSEIALDYTSPGVSQGFYEYYISTPGTMIPWSTRLGSLVDILPDWFKTIYYGQTIWQWIFLFLTVVVISMVTYLICLAFRRFSKRAPSPWDRWLSIISLILVGGSILAAINFIENILNLTGRPLSMVTTIGSAIVIILTAYLVFSLCRAIAYTIIALPHIPEKSINATQLRLSSSVIGALLFIWVIISGLNNIGVNMIPLVAGLGVGGVAVALAARPTMENIISSFLIFADKPYEVGQRIKVLGYEGTVESIGLRSTKLRLLTGHLTSIPNEKMASVEIENIGRRPHIRRNLNVTIPYDTSPIKINQALEILRDILAVPDTDNSNTLRNMDRDNYIEIPFEDSKKQSHPNESVNHPEFLPRVALNALNSDSLNLLVVYWYHPAEYWDYLEHATWVNVQIIERFNAAGIDFALPTQTLHVAGDDKRPLMVEQYNESDENSFPKNMIGAESAAGKVQVEQETASDSVRPEPITSSDSDKDTKIEGELTEAPLEEEVIQGENDGGAKDSADR